MRRDHFWKTQSGEDGCWVYELTLCDDEDRSGFDVAAVRHFLGRDGLGHEIEEVACDHFTGIEDAQRAYEARKEELARNGFTETEVDS